jgi:hypothetical protein
MTGSLASILWLRWRIFVVNLGLRFVGRSSASDGAERNARKVPVFSSRPLRFALGESLEELRSHRIVLPQILPGSL